MNKIIVIAGPTASGKSAVSVELAKLLQTEIISADSMQIYKGMDIGTAKITKDEMQGITHHMLDVVSPEKSYSVNEYTKAVKDIIKNLQNQNKIPIICGGTGLYINSLIYNFDLKEQQSDPVLRESLEKLYMEKGGDSLISMLKEFDPEAAERIHPNNYRRVIRAIEFYKVSGITMTEQIERTKNAPKEYDVSFFVLNAPREILYERINKRVDKMIADGLYSEVQKLYSEGLPKNATSMQAIGYKELTGVLNGCDTLENAIEMIKLESRRYAKRQLTWFRRNEDACWIDMTEFDNNPKRVAEHILKECLK